VTPVRVGVTGHRVIDDPEAVSGAVRDALAQVRDRFGGAGDTEAGNAGAAGVGAGGAARAAARLEAVSSLAEGADRIVAHAVLAEAGAALIVPLPMPADDYATDFAAPASKAEFEELLGRAARVEVMPAAATREEAYGRAGRWVVEHSDVLLALWDGEPSHGRGGTADIVAHARELGLPVYWIRTDRGAPVVERC
jgi:hypothetical protein